jgi:predicted phosphodiesterase
MLRIHIESDEHDDIRGNAMEPRDGMDADLIVCAGDMCAPGTLALRRLRELYPDRDVPVVYCPGNHDYYSEFNKHHPELKTTWERQRAEMPEIADKLGILLVDDSEHELDVAGMRVRIGGGTLWTDMNARPGYVSMNEAMREAGKRMNDYRLIKTGEGRSKDVLTPRDTIGAHRETVKFIDEMLSMPADGIDAVILVTHHAPSHRSLRRWDPARPENFQSLDWCYASDCERWFTGDGMGPDHVAPDLAIHGHVHANQDYVLGNTRVVANPRGYPLHALGMVGRENPDFDPNLIIELEPRYVPGIRI